MQMNKKSVNFILIISLIIIMSFTGCGSKTDTAKLGQDIDGQGYKSITPQEVIDIIGSEGVYLIDVREIEEFSKSHIDGAINIPLSNLTQTVEGQIADKDSILIVYCQGGIRSAKSARLLFNMEYINVFDVGGIDNWPYDNIVN